MDREVKKVDKWRKKMEHYRGAVTRDNLIADLKKAGFVIADKKLKGRNP